jgi:hypothetical protein
MMSRAQSVALWAEGNAAMVGRLVENSRLDRGATDDYCGFPKLGR